VAVLIRVYFLFFVEYFLFIVELMREHSTKSWREWNNDLFIYFAARVFTSIQENAPISSILVQLI